MNSDEPPNPHSLVLVLEPYETHHLQTLCGQCREHLRLIERHLGVEISERGNQFTLSGPPGQVATANALLRDLYASVRRGEELTGESLQAQLQPAHLDSLTDAAGTAARIEDAEGANSGTKTDDHSAAQTDQHGGTQADGPADTQAENAQVENLAVIRTRRASVRPRGKNQQAYVRTINRCDVNFGIGPAGTGKTWLAVACAVQALMADKVERILLVRPAVEAGEKLGFLPGDLSQKIDPYLRPLYDALYAMLGFDTVNKHIERDIIEVAPLAFMRGRTLNNAFIILDEAQNTTREQMKMFLTRIGFGSTAVITGDITQIDLPQGAKSGLTHAMQVLDGVAGLGFTYFQARDVVRHPLVQRIVEAYDEYDAGRATRLDSQRPQRS